MFSSGKDDETSTTTIKPRKKTTSAVDVKLHIEEKVNSQIIGCDITAKSTMKFERIKAMYCQHRSYKQEEYMFAIDGVLIESSQTLMQLGLTAMDKTYVINVYHCDKVNISN